MDLLAQIPALLIGGLAGALGFLAARLVSRIDWTSHKQSEMSALTEALRGVVARLETQTEASAAKAAATREELVSVEARVGALEEASGKIADALDRLARLEERQAAAADKLDEAADTGRAVIQLSEQVKTIFKRIDQMADAMPTATARALWGLIQNQPGLSTAR